MIGANVVQTQRALVVCVWGVVVWCVACAADPSPAPDPQQPASTSWSEHVDVSSEVAATVRRARASLDAWASLSQPGALDAYTDALRRTFRGACAPQELASVRLRLKAELARGRASAPKLAGCVWDSSAHPPLKGALMHNGAPSDAPLQPSPSADRWRVHVVLQHPTPDAGPSPTAAQQAPTHPSADDVDACQRRTVSTVLSAPALTVSAVISDQRAWSPMVQDPVYWRAFWGADMPPELPEVYRLLGLPTLPRRAWLSGGAATSADILEHLGGAVTVWGAQQPHVSRALSAHAEAGPEGIRRAAAQRMLGGDMLATSALMRGVTAASAVSSRTSWVIIGLEHEADVYAKIRSLQEAAHWVEFVVYRCPTGADGAGSEQAPAEPS